MCHHRGDIPDWDRERVVINLDDEDDTAEEADDELPDFLNEEGSDDTTVLTDGGDES
jgi:hypothetical protein